MDDVNFEKRKRERERAKRLLTFIKQVFNFPI